MQQIDYLIDTLALDQFDYAPPLIALNRHLHLRRPSYLVLLYLLVTLVLLYLNIAPLFLSDLIGFAYPALQTVNSLQSLSQNPLRWTTYWICYCLLLLSHRLIMHLAQPNFTFYALRSAFFIYLFGPGSQKLVLMAQGLYNQYAASIDRKLRLLNPI